MKIKFIISAITTLSIALFVALGCTKQNDGIEPPFCGKCERLVSAQFCGSGRTLLSCGPTAFLPMIRNRHSPSLPAIPVQLHVIKGIALDAYEYGRKIKLVEDLIGNFPKGIDTFMVWGNIGEHPSDVSYIHTGINRREYLACYDCYKKGDVLIMLLDRAVGWNEVDVNAWGFPPEYEQRWIETSEHFSTSSCANAVLWLKHGNLVVGHVDWEEYHVPHPYHNVVRRDTIYAMSLRSFRSELNNVLKR